MVIPLDSSDPGFYDNDASANGSRQIAKALRTCALLVEKLTGASSVVLSLQTDRAQQMDLRDCLIGPHGEVAALLVMSRKCLSPFVQGPEDAPKPRMEQPVHLGRIGPEGYPAAARALFLRTGECIGALSFCTGKGASGTGAAVPDGRLLQGLDLLGLTIEELLNQRLTQIELQQELSDSRAQAQTLRRISEKDPLTGLANVAAFERRSRKALDLPGQTALLVLLDIDHFKTINDLYGHQFGDLYLRTIARAVQDCAPRDAVAGRLGGDEFGVLLELEAPLSDEALKLRMAQFSNRILQATAPLNKPDLGRVSIGAARYPQDAGDYQKLHNCADLALYASKATGRGSATLFSTGIGERYDYTELAKNFRAACEAGQVVPFFQPMVDLESGQALVYEVLCRWDNPRHGLMAPETFSSIFTDHEFATHLTRHMAREALKLFSQARPGLADGAKLSLNLTYFDLMDREFVFELQSVLTDNRVDWSEIVLEVQETVVMDEDNGQVFRSLSELRRRGAEIALDDYGTGYGALKHLRNWPVDMLKIDKGFVRNICTERRDRAIVSSILQLSQDLGFRVVAEGVESAEQAQLLSDMGCDLGQGFGFGRPMTPGAFLEAAARPVPHWPERLYQASPPGEKTDLERRVSVRFLPMARDA